MRAIICTIFVVVCAVLTVLPRSCHTAAAPGAPRSVTRTPIIVTAPAGRSTKNKSKSESEKQIAGSRVDGAAATEALVRMIGRLPGAAAIATFDGAASFLQTAVILIPLGLVLKIGLVSQGKTWLKEGSKLGIEWGQVSALYAFGEKLTEKVRAVEDRWNSYIGSGICSAFMRYKEGRLSMAQGFIAGVALMYTLDRLLPRLTAVPPINETTLATQRRATAGAGTARSMLSKRRKLY